MLDLKAVLPVNATISKGQEISGMEMLQNPRLQAFREANPTLFRYPYVTRDVMVYIGPDLEIP